ncbi:hypothetical protein BH10PLA1_BH10PLA1_17280 [soil metagenome]
MMKQFTSQFRAACAKVFFALALFAGSSVALAAPNTADYLRSLSSGVSGAGKSTSVEEGPSHLLAYVVLAAAVITILIWWAARDRAPRKAKQVNHSRKLLRQISRDIGLAGVEVKQLKLLAEVHERISGKPLKNPLTLLICPSILGVTLADHDVKIDRAVVAGLARRLSRQATKV